MDVETFITENGVDDGSANDLRGCPVEVQEIVIGRGTLAGTSNPSGALIGRIMRARSQAMGGRFENLSKEELGMDVEEFLAEGGADASSSNDLRGCPAEVQRIVLAGGSLTGASNPSGALIGRIKRARMKAGGGGGYHKAPSRDELEMFIAEGGVDEGSANDLRGAPGDVQALVISQGPLTGASNPSGALIGRIKKARLQAKEGPGGGGSGGGGLGVGGPMLSALEQMLGSNPIMQQRAKLSLEGILPAEADDVEDFLDANPVELHAEERFRHLDPRLQKVVLNKGSLENTRDATAVLISRIVAAEKAASGEVGNMKPGDWICPSCGDHQFARNTICRKCGSEKPAAAALGDPTPSHASATMPGLIPAEAEDVEDFLASNPVELHAEQQFYNLDPKLQRLVMNRGPLAGARDPTGMLIGRMVAVEKAARGAANGETGKRPAPLAQPVATQQRALFMAMQAQMAAMMCSMMPSMPMPGMAPAGKAPVSNKPNAANPDQVFHGTIDNVNYDKGWGRIHCEGLKKILGKESIMILKASLAKLPPDSEGKSVSFKVKLGQGNKDAHAVEVEIVERSPEERFVGKVRTFNTEKGWGFIDCAEAKAIFQSDVFFHRKDLNGLAVQPGDHVEFSVDVEFSGRAAAFDIVLGRSPPKKPSQATKAAAPATKQKVRPSMAPHLAKRSSPY